MAAQTTPSPRPSRRTASKAQLSHSASPHIPLDPESRRGRIAEAAYYRAERRGFAPGYEIDDWLAAESEVDTELTMGVAPSSN